MKKLVKFFDFLTVYLFHSTFLSSYFLIMSSMYVMGSKCP